MKNRDSLEIVPKFVTVHSFAAHSNMMHTYSGVQRQNSIVLK